MQPSGGPQAGYAIMAFLACPERAWTRRGHPVASTSMATEDYGEVLRNTENSRIFLLVYVCPCK
jgi:hypothetical protein